MELVSSQPEASTSAAAHSPLCTICHARPAVYTCPRCSTHTCSATCSSGHKTLGAGCSGERDKAAFVPMNQYGYMTLMNDYTFLEEVGRKIGDWGREIVQGGFAAGGADRGHGRMAHPRRGRGGGGMARHAGGKPRSKRDVMKMQLDFRDIDMELLPTGMERRILNQSTWDFKNKTALLTIEFKFHPTRDPLAGSTAPEDPPFTLLAHRNSIEKTLLSILQSQVAERSKSKKGDPVPTWVHQLVLPDPDVPDLFIPPVCVMQTSIDPLASLSTHGTSSLRPGRIQRQGYYKLDLAKALSTNLKRKTFVEFPTIEVWEDGAFEGTIIDDQGSVLQDTEEHYSKRRKLSQRDGKNAIAGLLGGYGSEDEEASEEHNVLSMLDGYAGSDEDANDISMANADVLDDGLSDEDAEGETDDELEGSPEDLARLLEQLREAGALRDPTADRRLDSLADADEERVDWGDSGEDEG